jgi:hypothetical protein
MAVREITVGELPPEDAVRMGVDDLAPAVILIIAVDESKVEGEIHPEKEDLLMIRIP